MRALVTADVCGGVLTWATELVTQLAEHGVEVELVTFGGRASAAQRARIEASGPADWHESELALEWMADPWSDLAQAADELRALESGGGHDVVHLSGFGHAAAGFRAPVIITAHSDVWSWWQAVHGWDPPRTWDRYRTWVRAGLRQAEAVIAPTAAMLADLRHNYGPWAGRTVVLPNAVASEGADSYVESSREPVALAAGRMWDPAKNGRALARAAARLPRGTVRIAGDPRGAPDLSPAICLGELTPAQLAAERRRAAVFAAPARYEPFGLAALEAALDGCALVLGDIPSLRELWDEAAWFVDPADETKLATAIDALISDTAAAHRWGRRAWERARELGGLPAFGRAHCRLYEELARLSSVAER